MRAAPVSRPVILAVDDELGVREVFQLILEEDYEVVLAADGRSALEVVNARPVDLVLLDLLMPGESGLAVLEELSRRSARLPVIVVTAVDTAAPAVAAMKLGAVDYVTKPFEEQELVDLVRRTLAERSGLGDHRTRILVVVGDLGIRATLAVLLGDDHRVEVMASPLDALAATPPDLLLLGTHTAHGAGAAVIRNLCDRARAYVFFSSPLDVARLQQDIAAHLPAQRVSWYSSRLTTRVIEHVSRDYPRANVELVACALGISASHLSHAFRDRMATTVKDFITRVRIQAAKYLLRETDDKVEMIAERVGLYDASHLSRVFRQHAETSPGTFRRA